MFRIDDFVKRLEDEMRKIDAFKRELPLSMMLLNDAIVILKEESMQCRTTNIEPVLEEFIPLKKNCDEEEKIEAIKTRGDYQWLGFPLGLRIQGEKVSSNGLVSKTRGIRPVSSSTPNSKPNLQAGPPQPQYQNARKQRRCWSPELHRRFVSALQQLGGPQVATPKQIRELIQVDGLTNDEIKSHLQKYRLHARKPPAAANKSPVNFRGLWLPPPQDDRFGESAKQSNSKSESPQGPLQLDGGGTCTTGEEEGDDGDDDDTDDEDEKSESYGWKIHIPKYGN
ncbi:myb-like transcription factor family protein [Actinidia rufa]|uniref:Myb-like transcription factor family protein n=1 Tax=Actinidia rufa TaxID=165716 RepID=A0A7J0EUG4_9ERIC|nr:myb-like transcription factor family protein [Actinidia rufa]